MKPTRIIYDRSAWHTSRHNFPIFSSSSSFVSVCTSLTFCLVYFFLHNFCYAKWGCILFPCQWCRKIFCINTNSIKIFSNWCRKMTAFRCRLLTLGWLLNNSPDFQMQCRIYNVFCAIIDFCFPTFGAEEVTASAVQMTSECYLFLLLHLRWPLQCPKTMTINPFMDRVLYYI